MRIIRFKQKNEASILAAVTDDNKIYTLPFTDFMNLVNEAENQKITPLALVENVIASSLPIVESIDEISLLVPIVAPEVWACGVTYEKSRDARKYESTGGKANVTTYYDKVYDADRPEIFFKSTAARTIGPDDAVHIRSDSNWQIPEPELGLVINKDGKILGYTIGNDMSCRDIEGENPLYLPQAKIWENSCSIGPAIRLAETVEDPYNLQITCRIYRVNQKVVEGTANTKQLKRKYSELISYLIKDNKIFDGTVLLTGTCIVPSNEFTLLNGDRIEIEISGIGILKNNVKLAVSKEQLV